MRWVLPLVVATALPGPILAETSVSCRMQYGCVDALDCIRQDTFARFTTADRVTAGATGSGQLALNDADSAAFQSTFRLDDYGTFTVTHRDDAGAVHRLISTSRDGLGVLQVHDPGTGLSALWYGVCSWP